MTQRAFYDGENVKMQTDTNINTKYGDSFLKAQGDIFKLMFAEESMDNLYIFVNGYILYS